MLKMKLFRIGKRDQARYRIVVAERRSKRGGKYVAALGTYNPETDPPTIKLDVQQYQDWLQKGAKPTETVADLYKRVTAK